MSGLRIVLFDVDGVLLDSLPSHLKICEDKNREYRLGLRIPNASEFKKMVHSGTRISPMEYFFMAVGFPEDFAEKANLQYQEIFMKKYAPPPFPPVHSMLSGLHDAGLQLGIVTSNIKANVVEALGQSIQFFRPNCIFTKDEMADRSKSEAITSAMAELQAKPAETLYVGDQPADWEAAKAAGVSFLGVSYGWGISGQDKDFPIARDVPGISRYVLAHR